MTRILIYFDSLGRISGFMSQGHSGYAKAGEDVVCAGVSALTQAAILGITEYLQVEDIDLDVDPEQVIIDFHLKDSPAAQMNEIQAILHTMLLGLQEISQQYPEYLKIDDYNEGGASHDSF